MTALDFRTGHPCVDTQRRAAGSEPTLPARQADRDAQSSFAGGDSTWSGSEATRPGTGPSNPPSLFDPLLALAAAVLDDAERTKTANNNRLRQLTRTTIDSDGEERGFGMKEDHPVVKQLAALVAALDQIDHDATLNLGRMMRQHPLWPWCKAHRGIGEKQGARLLAAIRDPYWHNETVNKDGSIRHPEGPRTVSELWSFCGLAPKDGVAIRRTKGVKSNWSANAKMRAYLVAESCSKQLTRPCKEAGEHLSDCECGHFRRVYEDRKSHTEGRVHIAACAQCGPAGKPAQPGSPWSDGHRHADALRIVSKTLLKGLWLEARRIHEEPNDVVA